METVTEGDGEEGEGAGLAQRASGLVGKIISRVNLRARKTSGIEVWVTGRWLVIGSTNTGGVVLGPSQVPEVLPGHEGVIVTDFLHVRSIRDRVSYHNASRSRMACDGVAFLVDADENREREVIAEMISRGEEYTSATAQICLAGRRGQR